MNKCAYDADGDGECCRCFGRGGCESIGGPFEFTVQKAISKLHHGEISPEDVVQLFQRVYDQYPELQFDQLERRVLFGYPFAKKVSE